jgi:hypothetical protein
MYIKEGFDVVGSYKIVNDIHLLNQIVCKTPNEYYVHIVDKTCRFMNMLRYMGWNIANCTVKFSWITGTLPAGLWQPVMTGKKAEAG